MDTKCKETKIGWIPEKWELLPFDDCVDRKGNIGKCYKLQTKEYLDEGRYPIIDQGQEFIAGYTNDDNAVYNGSLPVTIFGDHTLFVKFVSMKFVIGADGTVPLYPNKNKLTDKFFYYLISNHKIKSEGYQRHVKYLRQKRFAIPPLPEQRNIAEILSTVDEAIEKTNAIIQETQQLKRGLMQKLFSRGIGHTHFKETKIGLIPEEWECLQARDITNRITDGSHLSPKPSNSSPYLIATVKDVGDYGLNLETCVGISEGDYNQLVRNGCKPFIGDVLLTKDGSVGKTLVWDYDQEIVLLSSIAIFSPKAKIIDSVFMKYFLDSNINQSWLQRLTGGTALQRVILKDLRKLLIFIPPIPEQCKIAEILSEVDSKIKAEQAYKSKLEKLKKGLMQVLLTGKVRVKV